MITCCDYPYVKKINTRFVEPCEILQSMSPLHLQFKKKYACVDYVKVRQPQKFELLIPNIIRSTSIFIVSQFSGCVKIATFRNLSLSVKLVLESPYS